MRQRSPAVWELVVSVGRDPLNGRWRYKSRTVRGTKREAQRALAALVHDVGAGTVRPNDVTVSETLERWLEIAGGYMSPTTLREYRRLIARRISPALGHVSIAKLTTAQIDAFYLALSQHAELSPSSVRQMHSVLRRGLRQAVRWRWIVSNPAVNATLPRRHRSELSPPTPSTIRLLLQAAAKHDPSL